MKEKDRTKKLLRERLAKLRQRMAAVNKSKSEYKMAFKKIQKQKNILENTIESLDHPFYLIDVNDYTVILANSAACSGKLSKKTTCYSLTHNLSSPCEGAEHVCLLEFLKMTKKPVSAEHIHYINGERRIFDVRGYPIFDKKGNIVQMIEYSLEITERKRQEEHIKKSLKEKEVLLQEIHHRVKNNMQIISSLLKLQAGRIKSKEIQEVCEISQNRIKSMALVHEKLYQSKDLAKVDFAQYIQSLAIHLFNTYNVNTNTVRLKTAVKHVSLNINKAVPCGLIINELVSNSLKHGFPEGREGEIHIKIHRIENGKYKLIVRDNGVGIPEELDILKTKTLGLTLVNLLVDQLNGSIEIDRKDRTSFKITF